MCVFFTGTEGFDQSTVHFMNLFNSNRVISRITNFGVLVNYGVPAKKGHPKAKIGGVGGVGFKLKGVGGS